MEFEGPEKTLEVCFAPVGVGCRALDAETIRLILAEARCTILSKVSNSHLDAYVLSESSLFVYPFKWVIKTCGRTTLLKCLRKLVEYTSQKSMKVEWVGYSRKNWVFPDDQPSPHTSFHEEIEYLKQHDGEAFEGSGYVLGPVTGDHWFVYIADQCERPVSQPERTVNIMMFDLPDSVRAVFSTGEDARGMTLKSGLASLVGDHSLVDAQAFAPCGYSMNSLVYGSYTTVHVTPEPSCSYASFETNTALKSYGSLFKNVLSVFKPRRVLVTLFADEAGLSELNRSATMDGLPRLDVPKLGTYVRADFSSLCVETDAVCMMANYVLEEDAASPPSVGGRRSRRVNSRPNNLDSLASSTMLGGPPPHLLALDATTKIHVGSLP